MDTAAFERVKKSVNKLRQPAPVSSDILSTASIGRVTEGVKPLPDKDPWDFGSNAAPAGLGGVKPFPSRDPWDF